MVTFHGAKLLPWKLKSKPLQWFRNEIYCLRKSIQWKLTGTSRLKNDCNSIDEPIFISKKKRMSTFKWTRILKIYIDHFIVDFENVVQKTFKNKCSLKLRRYSLANQKDGFTNKCWVLRDLRFKRHKIMEWFIYVMADALFIDGELKVDKKINSLF